MTSFLLLLIAFVTSCYGSSLRKKKQALDYISATTTNCRLEYQIGCDMFDEFVALYAQYASIKRMGYQAESVTIIEFICGLLGKPESEIKEYLQNNDIYSELDKVTENGFDTWALSVCYRDGDLFSKITQNKDKKFAIPIGGTIYVESENGVSYYQMLKAEFCKYYETALVELKWIKPRATELRSKYAINKVAEHYGLPREEELQGSVYACNRMSLANLIFEYSEREIRKKGYSGAQKSFFHFTSNPTEEDFLKAEECDSFTVRSTKVAAANDEVMKKYPWINPYLANSSQLLEEADRYAKKHPKLYRFSKRHMNQQETKE